jgi:hypothetical protein
MALFLTQMLVGALKDLVTKDNDPEAMLAELKNEEDLLYEEFKQAGLPPASQFLNTGKSPDVDIELLFRGRNICRTARTPSQTRYLGYGTDSDKKGGIAAAGKEKYDIGIERQDADKTDADGVMRLVYERGERENCPVPVKIDYKDFYYTHGKDGWSMLTIPNNKEKEAYGYDPAAVKGFLILCPASCPWGKCQAGDLNIAEAFDKNQLEMEVNLTPVTSVIKFDIYNGCFVLKGDNGVYWKPNNEGSFNLKARVTSPNEYLRISAVVLY